MALFAALNNGFLNYYLSIPFLLILAKKYAYPSKHRWIYLPLVTSFGIGLFLINNQVPKSDYLYSKINSQITLAEPEEIFRVQCLPTQPCYQNSTCRDGSMNWKFSDSNYKPEINCFETKTIPKGEVLTLKRVIYKFGILNDLFDGLFVSDKTGNNFIVANHHAAEKYGTSFDSSWDNFGRTKLGEKVDSIIVFIVWMGIVIGIGIILGLIYDVLKFIFVGIWDLTETKKDPKGP